MAVENRKGFQVVAEAPWLMNKTFWMDPAVSHQPAPDAAQDDMSGLNHDHEMPWAAPPPAAVAQIKWPCSKKNKKKELADTKAPTSFLHDAFDDALWIAGSLEDLQSIDKLLDGILSNDLVCYMTHAYEDINVLLEANLMGRVCRLLQGGLQVVKTDVTRSIHVDTTESGFDCGTRTFESPIDHCNWIAMGEGDFEENWCLVDHDPKPIEGRKLRKTNAPEMTGRIKRISHCFTRCKVDWDEGDEESRDPIGQGCMLHVRNIGVYGWDGTEEGRGTFESAEALGRLLSRFGNVVNIEIRHRITEGTAIDGADENTSWALLTMSTKTACDRAMKAADLGKVLAGAVKLRITRFDMNQASKSKGDMNKIRRLSMAAVNQHKNKMRRTRSSLHESDADNWIDVAELSIECLQETWRKLEERGHSDGVSGTAKESEPVVMVLAKAAYCAVADEEQCCGILSLLLRYDSFWEDREIPEVVSQVRICVSTRLRAVRWCTVTCLATDVVGCCFPIAADRVEVASVRA